jgi:hypothetical protein
MNLKTNFYNMKKSFSVIATVTVIITLIMHCSNLSGQEVIVKTQTGEKKFNTDKIIKPVKPESLSKQITHNTSNGASQRLPGWKLTEDFESVNFPPDQWYAYNGWQQAGYSSYGTGNYSAYFCNFCCDEIYNELRTSYFDLTETGDVLTFDVAYAPRGDSN